MNRFRKNGRTSWCLQSITMCLSQTVSYAEKLRGGPKHWRSQGWPKEPCPR